MIASGNCSLKCSLRNRNIYLGTLVYVICIYTILNYLVNFFYFLRFFAIFSSLLPYICVCVSIYFSRLYYNVQDVPTTCVARRGAQPGDVRSVVSDDRPYRTDHIRLGVFTYRRGHRKCFIVFIICLCRRRFSVGVHIYT